MAVLTMTCYLLLIVGINELEGILYEIIFPGDRKVLHLGRYLIVIGMAALFVSYRIL